MILIYLIFKAKKQNRSRWRGWGVGGGDCSATVRAAETEVHEEGLSQTNCVPAVAQPSPQSAAICVRCGAH